MIYKYIKLIFFIKFEQINNITAIMSANNYSLVAVTNLDHIRLVEEMISSSYSSWDNTEWKSDTLPVTSWRQGFKCLWLVKEYPVYIFLKDGIPHRTDDAALWQATNLSNTWDDELLEWEYCKNYILDGQVVQPSEFLYRTTPLPSELIQHIETFTPAILNL
jgi:hypothetical protein